jgi:dihydrofolate synthase/folylpolyglutamate synthase
MLSATDWIASLSPWPEKFGLERMDKLLERLGHPQRSFRAIHVVGTNGKSTAARTLEALLLHEGLSVGCYTSPHVRDWAERIRVDGEDADFDAAVRPIRGEAEAAGATQFEALTAAAFAAFAAAGVDVAAVEAGLGGRLDATNVIDAPVVLLTNVAREHTEVLGEKPEEIAKEKLAVAHAASVVVLRDNTFANLVPGARIVLGGAREAAEAFLGRAIDAQVEVALPGRLEIRGTSPLEIWDGAHNAAGAEWLAGRLPSRDFVLVVSILDDKDAGRMLTELRPFATRVITTQSRNSRAWTADELAQIVANVGEDHPFRSVEAIPSPPEALAQARRLAGKDGAVLVTGSLYLLADLYARE